MQRKFRHKILDSQGQVKSLENSLLAYGKLYSQKLEHSSQEIVILLGLGVEARIISEHLNHPQIYFLENPDFTKQMPSDFLTSLTTNFTQLSLSELYELLDKLEVQSYSIWQYQANSKLFPEFWLDILAQIKTKSISKTFSFANKPKCIAIPCSNQELLTYELSEACTQNGYTTFLINTQNCESEILELAKSSQIELFLSVNMRGLNPNIYSLLKALNIKIVIWFVDNPFNIINKHNFWLDACICVSSSYFVKTLRNFGAKDVHYLPLASSNSLALAAQKNTDKLDLLFVGRTSFPKYKSFFSGAKKYPELLELAQKMIAQNLAPDFAWWQSQLVQVNNISQRDISYNTELTNLDFRQFWLNSLDNYNLTVVGDTAWSELLSAKIKLQNAVDYYHGLFSLYKSASYTINITSLLLPNALTQRHFDVWLAGGFLLSNFTEDLRIFQLDPSLYSAQSPQGLIKLVQIYEESPTLKREITDAMQAEILSKHLYKHRIAQIILMLEDKKSTCHNETEADYMIKT